MLMLTSISPIAHTQTCYGELELVLQNWLLAKARVVGRGNEETGCCFSRSVWKMALNFNSAWKVLFANLSGK